LSNDEYASHGVDGLYSTLFRQIDAQARSYVTNQDKRFKEHGKLSQQTQEQPENPTSDPAPKRLVADEFKNLISSAWEKTGERVVVIIDEYDEPLISTLNDRVTHEKMRDVMQSFLGVLKSYSKYLRFVFVTGITKFSQVTAFSGFNQAIDLTLMSKYADICGFTQEELERDFAPELDSCSKYTTDVREEYLAALRKFYNGYRFSDAEVTVYNPFGMLNHFENNGQFVEYWTEAVTPTFLVDLIVKQKVNLNEIQERERGRLDFSNVSIDNMDAVSMLWQTGFLTIASYDKTRKIYTLDYPNDEVRQTFPKTLIALSLKISSRRATALHEKMATALEDGNVQAIMKTLSEFFAATSYDLAKDYEVYFQIIVHVIFRMLGFDNQVELRTGNGRIDMVLATPKYVYLFEFKRDRSAEEAMKQIEDKDYPTALRESAKDRQIIKIGVNFSSTLRNIQAWLSETL
jgi:hypothetical protein